MRYVLSILSIDFKMYYFSGNFTAFGYLKKGLTAVMFKQRVEAFE